MSDFPEWLAIVLYFYGIALGLLIGWKLWREPKLEYLESNDE